MNQPQIIELYNQRLLTTEQLADFYEATPKNIRDNFQNNREKFIEGKHFHRLEGAELKAFKNDTENIGIVGNRVNQLILYTKQGASRHSKMLGTDRAWDMYDELEENYFNPKQQIQIPTTQRELARLALAASEETNQRVDELDTRVADLEENTVLSAGDYGYISRRINQRVAEVARGFGRLTQEQRGKLHKDINSGVKAVTGVSTRTQLRNRHYETVLDFINDWEPSTATKMQVRQMTLDLETA